ncbi:MAG: hypothetical protein HQK53_09890 [Oligoflexia bacterium]|nr:hypothetical protein [Oligoflexia bacterium]
MNEEEAIKLRKAEINNFITNDWPRKIDINCVGLLLFTNHNTENKPTTPYTQLNSHPAIIAFLEYLSDGMFSKHMAHHTNMDMNTDLTPSPSTHNCEVILTSMYQKPFYLALLKLESSNKTLDKTLASCASVIKLVIDSAVRTHQKLNQNNLEFPLKIATLFLTEEKIQKILAEKLVEQHPGIFFERLVINS